MNKSLKFVLIIVGVVLIVFGFMCPTIFEEKDEDKFEFVPKSSFVNYSMEITIKSKKDYTINSAEIVLTDIFEDNTLTKYFNETLTSVQHGNNFDYTLTISLSRDEYFEFSKVAKVELNTTIGERTAVKGTLGASISHIPVMIFCLAFGFGATFGGILMFVYPALKSKTHTYLKNEITKAGVDISNYTDDEILAKYEDYFYNRVKEEGIDLDAVDEEGNKIYNEHKLFDFTKEDYKKMFATPKQEQATIKCEYCDYENDASSKKCTQCGATLKRK